MKIVWIILSALVAAAAYGGFSWLLTATWHPSLMFVVGVLAALICSGIRQQTAVVAGGMIGALPEADDDDDDDESVPAEAYRPDPRTGPMPYPEFGAAMPEWATPAMGTAGAAPQPWRDGRSPEELFAQAERMLADMDPEMPPVLSDDYLDLLYGAAEGGHVAALARLGEYAFCRQAFVEAYFWTKLARRRLELSNPDFASGLQEIDLMARNIRGAWFQAGRPPEFENVYENFPAERGELGRAFLHLDSGIEVKRARGFVAFLAEQGNPDAALFS